MTNAANYRRPPFPNRPWITGKLYDDYARSSILHLDAYVFTFGSQRYLAIDWREGGHTRVALDGYVIGDNGLTPVWDIETLLWRGVPERWTRENHGVMRRVHQTVLAQPARMVALGLGRWSRVVVQAHYVRLDATDPTPAGNKYTPPKPYAPRRISAFPDIL